MHMQYHIVHDSIVSDQPIISIKSLIGFIYAFGCYTRRGTQYGQIPSFVSQPQSITKNILLENGISSASWEEMGILNDRHALVSVRSYCLIIVCFQFYVNMRRAISLF